MDVKPKKKYKNISPILPPIIVVLGFRYGFIKQLDLAIVLGVSPFIVPCLIIFIRKIYIRKIESKFINDIGDWVIKTAQIIWYSLGSTGRFLDIVREEHWFLRDSDLKADKPLAVEARNILVDLCLAPPGRPIGKIRDNPFECIGLSDDAPVVWALYENLEKYQKQSKKKERERPKYPVLAVFGPPRSGKSSFLINIALTLAYKEQPKYLKNHIPILLSLSSTKFH